MGPTDEPSHFKYYGRNLYGRVSNAIVWIFGCSSLSMTRTSTKKKQSVRQRDKHAFDPRNFPRYIPDRLPVTLRTNFTLTYALASGNSYYLSQVISANDIRTPVASQQAMDRDQLFTLWSGARCYGFRITVNATTTTSGQAPRIAIGPCLSGVADPSLDMIAERKGAKHGYVVFGAPPKRMSMSSGVTDFIAAPSSSITDTTFLQLSGADLSAANVAYVQLCASNLVIAAAANVYADVQLEQFVVFQDLVQNADS